MSESMRDRLQAACDPHTVAYYDRDEILARVLAVLADPDDETVEAIERIAPPRWDFAAGVTIRAALTALVEHLREPQ